MRFSWGHGLRLPYQQRPLRRRFRLCRRGLHVFLVHLPAGGRLLGMLLRRLQRLSAAIAVLAFVDGGCHRAPRAHGLDDEIRSYLGDPRFRRRELEASLVDKTNAYSELRLLHYASGRQGDWDALPAWNPRVEPVTATELASPGGLRAKRKLGSAARPI